VKNINIVVKIRMINLKKNFKEKKWIQERIFKKKNRFGKKFKKKMNSGKNFEKKK
jgi:hypothetical protein